MISYKNILNIFLILSFITYSNSSCPPGTHPFLKSCLDCKEGTYSPKGYKCYECPPGTYNPEKGASECFYCEPGTYSSNYGSIGCHYCDPGTYAKDYGSSYCYKCPDYSTSGLGATSCYEMSFSQRLKKNAYNYEYNYQYDYM